MKRKTNPNYTYAKPAYKRGKYTSKWSAAPKSQLGGTTTKIRQLVTFADIVSTDGAAIFEAYNFTLSQLPSAQVTAFQELYDMWRIDKVTLHFIPSYNCNTPQSTPSGDGPSAGLLFTAKDYTNNTAPTSVAEVQQYQTAKYTPTYQEQWRSIKPQPLLDTAGDDTPVTGLVNPKSTWFDTANPGAQYVGIKLAYQSNGTGSVNAQSWSVIATYHMSFKNVK